MNYDPERIQVRRAVVRPKSGPEVRWIVAYKGRAAYRRAHPEAIALADDWAKWCWKGPVKVSDQDVKNTAPAGRPDCGCGPVECDEHRSMRYPPEQRAGVIRGWVRERKVSDQGGTLPVEGGA